MPDQQPQTLRQIADAPKMRAATPTERVVDQVRNWYDWLATQPLVRVADALGVTDIAGIARDEFTNPERFKMGTMPDGPGTLKGLAKGPIKAYHGSPHDFDQFSLSKIGTGEGVQAYGHGLYLTETPQVGRGYRDMTPVADRAAGVPLETNLRISGKPVDELYAEIERKAERMSPKDAEPLYEQLSGLESLMQHGDFLGVREAAEAGQVTPRAMEWMKSIEPKFTRTGKLYEVNIHADPHDFLDWDAPLSQQPNLAKRLGMSTRPEEEIHAEAERIMNAKPGGAWMKDPASKARIDALQAELDNRAPNLSGANFYRNTDPNNYLHAVLADDRGASAGRSSELKKAGIPGIKYLDGASRGKGEGSRNYVVFDDKLIEIVKKYGIAGAVSAGLINQAQARQLQEQGY